MNALLIFCLLTPVVLSIVIHEVAHGWVAFRLGDPTAKNLGRLSLNPIRHVSWVGSVLVPGMLFLTHSPFLFAWAKPVPIDARFFRSPRKGMGWVALAGPISNLILATFFAMVWRFGLSLSDSWPGIFCQSGVVVNLVLAIFNLTPIPPLDGGRIAVALLPRSWATVYGRLERAGFVIVVLMLFLGFFRFLMAPVGWLYQALVGVPL